MSIQSAGLLQPSMGSEQSLRKAGQGRELSHEMAQEFESLMLSQLIKQMRQSSGGEGLFPGDKSDTYGGMFDMMIGKHLAESGGFGLADQLASSFDGIGRSKSGFTNHNSNAKTQDVQNAYQAVNATKETTQ